jgi:hypothetical protein
MGIRTQKGDWFLGTQPVHKGAKLIYAMQISEVLPFEAYYVDPRFEKKKPKRKGPWQERCGDNMYYRDDKREWQQHPTFNHTEPSHIRQDLKHPYAFIGETFYYFGENAVDIPLAYQGLIRKRQGCKCRHDPETVDSFLHWLAQTFEPGIHGDPGDRPRDQQSAIELTV